MRLSLRSLFLALLLPLAACHNGTPVNPTTRTGSLEGRVAFAPSSGVQVTAYRLDAHLQRGEKLASAGADEAGAFHLDLPAYAGPVELVASSGSYTEPALGLGVKLPGDGLRAVVPSYRAPDQLQGLRIGPVSTWAAALATFHVRSRGESLAQALADAQSHLQGHFGGLDWSTVLPADLASQGAPQSLSPEARAGLIVAGLSQEALSISNRAGVSPGLSVNLLSLVQALALDLSDGTFDGMGPGGALVLPEGLAASADGGTSATALGADGARQLLAQGMGAFLDAPRNTSGLQRSDAATLLAAVAEDVDPYLFCPGGLAGASCGTHVVDTTPPTLHFLSPEADAGVHGLVAVQVEAFDQSQLQSLALEGPVALADGGTVAYDDQGCSAGQSHCHAILSGAVDVGTLPEGPATFTAKAQDAFGNKAQARLQVLVANHGPLLSVQTPSDGTTVVGQVQVSAVATAQNGSIASLVLVDPPAGISADTNPAPETFVASWDSTRSPEGKATLHFRAVDSYGTPADAYVQVTVDNVPFAQITAVVSAGAPIAGATVQVLALNDADGGLDTSLDGGPVLGVSTAPTDAQGRTTVVLTQENLSHRPVQLVASGSAVTYADPSDGSTPIALPQSFALTSILSDFSSSTAQTTAPVTLWTTLCDAAARPYLEGKNPTQPHPVPLHQALTLAEDAFARHVTTRVAWSVRTAVPASLTSGGPKTLTDEVYAALPDLALNQLARDWSYQAALTPGGVITAPAVVAALAGQDLYADDLFDGLGAGGARLFAPGSTPIPYDANTTRSVLALELDRFLKSPTNLSGLARADLVSAGVMDAMALDQSVFYPSALIAPPNPWSSLDADGPVITWGGLSSGQGVHGVVPVTAQAADQSLIQSFAFTGALEPQGAQLTSHTTPDGGEVDTLAGSLDVSALQDGPITLSAEAVDEHGNRSDSSISLFVSNHGPDLSILSPSAGTSVAGTVQVRAQATARNGSVQSLVLVGTVAGMGPNTSSSGDTFTANWDTTAALEGPVTLQFLATDTYGATTDASVQVTVDNVPFGKVTVSVFAGVPVSGATLKVYAVSDADGGYDDRGGLGALLGQGGPTAGSNDPQVAPGTAVVTLSQENYRGPIQVVVDGTGVTYPDPSDSSTTISVPGTFRFTSYVADYRTGDAISVPVSLWTTVADAAAAAYVRGSQKAASGPQGPQSLSAAMAITDPLMSGHVSDGHASWALRTTLPVPLTDGSQQTLRDAVFASLADVALNRLARDISTNAGASPGSVITAVSLAQQLASDVGSDGWFDGLAGATQLQVGNHPPYLLSGATARVKLAYALDHFIASASNTSGLSHTDLLQGGVYDHLSMDQSALYDPAQAPQPFDTQPPHVTFRVSFANGPAVPDGGYAPVDTLALVGGTLTVVADATDPSGVASLQVLAGATPISPSAGSSASHFEGTIDSHLLGEGPLTLSATSADTLGNSGTETYGLTVDNTPPTLTEVAPNPQTFYSSTVPFQLSCADLHGCTLSYTGTLFASMVRQPTTPDVLTASWGITARDGLRSDAFTVADSVHNVAQIQVGVEVDRTAPALQIVTRPWPNTSQDHADFTLKVTDSGAGVAAVFANCNGVTYSGTRTSTQDGWAVTGIPLNAGTNTITLWATDAASPANGSMAQGTQVTVIRDNAAPLINVQSTPSYKDESTMTLATTASGDPVMPAQYVLTGYKVAVVDGTDIAKSSSTWSNPNPTAAELESTNANNTPFIQVGVDYTAGRDSAIQAVTYTATCVIVNSPSVPTSGNLLPSPRTMTGQLFYDLPLSSQTLSHAESCSVYDVTISAKDAAGNTSSVLVRVFPTILAPPLTFAEDTSYAGLASLDSAYGYSVGAGTYDHSLDASNGQLVGGKARLVRYVAQNPYSFPVALDLQVSNPSLVLSERWDTISKAWPQGYSYTDQGITFDATEVWTQGNGCDPAPCGHNASAYYPYRVIGGQWSTFNCQAQPLPQDSQGQLGQVSSTTALSAAGFLPVSGATSGENQAASASSAGHVIVPAATSATTPGRVVFYVARPAAVRQVLIGPNLWWVPTFSGSAQTDYGYQQYQLDWWKPGASAGTCGAYDKLYWNAYRTELRLGLATETFSYGLRALTVALSPGTTDEVGSERLLLQRVAQTRTVTH